MIDYKVIGKRFKESRKLMNMTQEMKTVLGLGIE